MKTKPLKIIAIVVVACVMVLFALKLYARKRDENAIREETKTASSHLGRLAGADPRLLDRAVILLGLIGKGYVLSDSEWEELFEIANSSTKADVRSVTGTIALGAISAGLKNSPEKSARAFHVASEIIERPESASQASLVSRCLEVMDASNDPRSKTYFTKFVADQRPNVHNIILSYEAKNGSLN